MLHLICSMSIALLFSLIVFLRFSEPFNCLKVFNCIMPRHSSISQIHISPFKTRVKIRSLVSSDHTLKILITVFLYPVYSYICIHSYFLKNILLLTIKGGVSMLSASKLSQQHNSGFFYQLADCHITSNLFDVLLVYALNQILSI